MRYHVIGRSHTPTQRNTPSQRPFAQRKKISLLSSRAMCVVALLGGERFVTGGWAKTGAVKAIFECENGGAERKRTKENETVSRAMRNKGVGQREAPATGEKSSEVAKARSGRLLGRKSGQVCAVRVHRGFSCARAPAASPSSIHPVRRCMPCPSSR